MTRRIVAIVIAVVLAGLGTAGVLFYALNADQRAKDRLTGAVQIAIAAKRIPAGTSGARIREENLVRFENVPKTSAPSDALSSIPAGLDNLVVTSNVQVGQVLLRAMFDQQNTVAGGLSLPEGKMAVTVETSVPEQVAGYVQAGSQITVFITYDVLDSNGRATGFTRTRTLLPRVEVVAVGSYSPPRDSLAGTSSQGTSGRSGSLLVTLAVGQSEAERLVEAVRTGKLYVGLLTDSVTVRPGSGVDNADTGGGVAPLFP
jgi:pilus assembly protein CpaB